MTGITGLIPVCCPCPCQQNRNPRKDRVLKFYFFASGSQKAAEIIDSLHRLVLTQYVWQNTQTERPAKKKKKKNRNGHP